MTKTSVNRSITQWHRTVDKLGRTILYITSDEVGVPGGALCSIHDPLSDEPSYRLIDGERRLMTEPDQPYPHYGLVVLGSHKCNRPDFDAAAEMVGIKGHIAVAAIRADMAMRT